MQKCEENNSKQELDELVKYVDAYRNADAFELCVQFKNKNKRASGIKLTRGTVGIFTGLTCKCKNGCKFDVPHKKVNWEGGKQQSK